MTGSVVGKRADVYRRFDLVDGLRRGIYGGSGRGDRFALRGGPRFVKGKGDSHQN